MEEVQLLVSHAVVKGSLTPYCGGHHFSLDDILTNRKSLSHFLSNGYGWMEGGHAGGHA